MIIFMSLTMLAADERSTFSPPPVFAVSPLPLDKIRAIIPLGNLNPVVAMFFPRTIFTWITVAKRGCP